MFTHVPLLLRVDGFGLPFACVASLLWIATSVYAIGYMRGLHEHAQTRFYSFFAISLSATIGVAFSANLLTIYFFYEMLSVSTFPLVTHMQDKDARTGGRTYLGYLLFTSLCLLLPAMSWCYVWLDGGTVTMDFLADTGKVGDFSQTTQMVLLALFTFGFAKAGIMPLHSWLPGAMVAPTPVSALLHAVAVVKVGVFCVIRVYSDIFGIQVLQELDGEDWMIGIACATILISSLIALSQDNLKRRLAFSTIGQLGYVVLGATLATEQGVGGSVLHIAMHACGKITLFFCAGAIFVASGKKYVS
jgi:multicomponent Na+:H+ antiporter subunit D